jgi:O-antigen/teichoic acid export membrane protein
MAVNLSKKQNIKNIAMNIVAFSVQFFISFYISPLIVEKIGASAYGFIGLANDFVSYTSIIATVFNSVASRFIANAFYKKDYDRANKYFNSLIVANLLISGVLGLAGIILVPNLDKVLSIPTAILFDVKLTFALIFLSYILSLLTLVFTTSTFIANRTDIQGIRNIVQYFIRFILIIILFNFVSVKIYWFALATFIATVVVSIINVNLTNKLTPELKINYKDSNKKYVYELARSGCWMALSSVSTILLRGLDLTIANVMIGDYEMGLLSVARTIPNNITNIIGTIAPIFTPVFLAFYAKGDIDGLVENVKQSINAMALILYVPITGFIVFSYDFYSLWQKSLNPSELRIVTLLSIATVVQAYFNSNTSTLAQLSIVSNKLKAPVLASLICGIVSVLAEIFLIKYTNMGLYAIMLSTTVVMIVRYVFFNSVYGAYCLNKPRLTFMRRLCKTWALIPLLFVVMMYIKSVLPINSWSSLAIDILLSGFIGYFLVLLVLYGNQIAKFLSRRESS